MGRINRRIYATRRKRSPAKFSMLAGFRGMQSREDAQSGTKFTPEEMATNRSSYESKLRDMMGSSGGSINPGNRGINPDGMYSGGNTGIGRTNSMPRPNMYTQTHQPPYLGGSSDEAGIGGGKTYTITEA
tara:strand:+ start:71 stop:460 length:390 start_codon:yes stop_codon:yes gene_type:complete